MNRIIRGYSEIDGVFVLPTPSDAELFLIPLKKVDQGNRISAADTNKNTSII